MISQLHNQRYPIIMPKKSKHIINIIIVLIYI